MIYEVTMYAAKCDGCGKEVILAGEYSAFHNKENVRDDLVESEYYMDDANNKHYCPNCWYYDDDDNVIFKHQKQG